MIRAGFLSEDEREELRALARDGGSEARASRRANVIVLLNDGWSCEEVAAALLTDDDTVRGWYKLYDENGLTGLVGLPNAAEAKKMTECELTVKLCAYYSVVKKRSPSLKQKENLGVLARDFQESRIPFWADVKRYIHDTDADEPPETLSA
jgi:hypothetical protein